MIKWQGCTVISLQPQGLRSEEKGAVGETGVGEGSMIQRRI